MSEILQHVQLLAAQGKLRISDHGYNELAADGLLAGELIQNLNKAQAIEEYPSYPKGPCVLVLQRDSADAPVHVVWAFLAALLSRRFWSRRIALIQHDGTQVFCGDANGNPTTKQIGA